jgi:hypothetical protein
MRASFLFENMDVRNPAELAQPIAATLYRRSELHETERTPIEDFTVNRINEAIGALGLRGTYFVEAGTALIARPVSLMQNFTKRAARLSKITFEGRFVEYELIKMDGADINQERKIRSVCMAFRDATLLPYFDRLAGDNLVYVPVFAVDDITRTS